MRSIHADLITAQQSGAADPFIYLSINSTNYSSRLISLEHIEEPYRGAAVIVLANSDRHFYTTNLKGKAFTIGYGYVTTSGNRYCGDGSGSGAMPTLWVKTQSMVSMEGELVCILECEDGWAKLRETTFISTATSEGAPYFNIAFNTKFTSLETVYQVIQKALVEVGFTLSVESIDNIIQAFYPIFTANPLQYESPAAVIYQLLQTTKCYLREVESLGFETVFPQSSDAVQETYYSYQAPYFKEYVEKTNLLIPNCIAIFCNRDPSGEWDTPEYPLITGTAKDTVAVAANLAAGYTATGEVWHYDIAPYISLKLDADKRADAILTRLKNETLAGRLVLPFHDCRVELHDKSRVIDRRGI